MEKDSRGLDYYYSFYCAKKLYKNRKWYGRPSANRRVGEDNLLKFATLPKASGDRNPYRCYMSCPNFVWNGKKYICVEGKALNATWVEKNL